jgi:phosphoinositide-3-kinase regulatory subunit 4
LAYSCIIAELWLEGTPLFNLSELLSYRKVDDLTRYDPMTKINKIENEHVRRLIASMISLVPSERLSAMQYIKSWSVSALLGWNNPVSYLTFKSPDLNVLFHQDS